MRKVLLGLVLVNVIFFMNQSCLAGEVAIMAIEVGPILIRSEFKLALRSKGKHESKVSYLSKYQIINIIIENNTESILNVNPNYFILVSDMKTSYPYSAETYAIKNKIKLIPNGPLQSVDVYPETTTEGFLLFEKKVEHERPKTLYFKNMEVHQSVDIFLDPKVKKREDRDFFQTAKAEIAKCKHNKDTHACNRKVIKCKNISNEEYSKFVECVQ